MPTPHPKPTASKTLEYFEALEHAGGCRFPVVTPLDWCPTQAFKWVVGEVESRYFQALVNGNEMVGVVAAQARDTL